MLDIHELITLKLPGVAYVRLQYEPEIGRYAQRAADDEASDKRAKPFFLETEQRQLAKNREAREQASLRRTNLERAACQTRTKIGGPARKMQTQQRKP